MSHDSDLPRLRDAYADASESAVPIGPCPAPERIWESVAGELSPSEQREVLEHTATCQSCAADWDLAVAAQPDASRHTVPADRPSRRWRSWAPAAGLAATCLLAVGLLQLQTPRPPVERTAAGAELTSLLPAGEPLPRAAPELRWSYPSRDAQFSLTVSWLSPEGLVEIEEVEGLDRTHHRISAEAIERVPSGAQVYWKVTVFEGGEVTADRTFTVELE